jgi:carbon monoxide dehydrogenase subunit G
MYDFEVNVEQTINAPVHSVFDKLSDPVWVASVMPGLVENTNITHVPVETGDTFDYTYQMFGVINKGVWHVDEVTRPNVYKAHTDGQIPSEWNYEISGDTKSTKINLTVKYSMPEGLVGRASKEFVKSLNEKEAEHFMHNLKQYFELQF